VQHYVSTEVARHTNAVLEHIRTMITVVDEKYKDLPARVTKLEQARNTSKPKRARRAAR
jgi:hypothetical protein